MSKPKRKDNGKEEVTGERNHTGGPLRVLLAAVCAVGLLLTPALSGEASAKTLLSDDRFGELIIGPDDVPPPVSELSPKEQKKQNKAELKAAKKKQRSLMKQDLKRDQQQQLNERMKEMEGMEVGQRVWIERGMRGEAIERETDSLRKRAAFIRGLSEEDLPDSTLRELGVVWADSLGREEEAWTGWRELPDSVVMEVLSDSILRVAVSDSVLRSAPYEMFHSVDTAFLAGGKRPVTAQEEEEQVEKHKTRITQDTLRAGRVTWMSIVAPGFGQVYNRQPWKLPVIYGSIGGFLTGGFIYKHQHKQYSREYQRTLNMQLPPEVQKRANDKMRKARTGKTLMFSMAGATYLYSIADAVFNYRGPIDPRRKATTLAAIFPGMGFVYTKSYWRLPVYYGGFIALATVIDYNNRSYKRYKRAYNALTDGNPATVDEFNGRYSPELLARVRSSYRRDRDLAIILTGAAYLFSVIDTYVIATLKQWDVDENLSVRLEPTTIDMGLGRSDSGGGRNRSGFLSPGMPSQSYGMAVKIRF